MDVVLRTQLVHEALLVDQLVERTNRYKTAMNYKHLGRSPSDELTFSQRLEILVNVFDRQPLRPVLDKLSTFQLVQAHNFLWDKMVEFHARSQADEFQRQAVTRKMIPSAKYQRMRNCDLRIDYCKGVECIWSNPICAGNKVKLNMEVMAEHMRSLLNGMPDEISAEMQALR